MINALKWCSTWTVIHEFNLDRMVIVPRGNQSRTAPVFIIRPFWSTDRPIVFRLLFIWGFPDTFWLWRLPPMWYRFFDDPADVYVWKHVVEKEWCIICIERNCWQHLEWEQQCNPVRPRLTHPSTKTFSHASLERLRPEPATERGWLSC